MSSWTDSYGTGPGSVVVTPDSQVRFPLNLYSRYFQLSWCSSTISLSPKVNLISRFSDSEECNQLAASANRYAMLDEKWAKTLDCGHVGSETGPKITERSLADKP
jgi:hypothetical protein